MNFESGRTGTGERALCSQVPAAKGPTRRRFIGAAGGAGVLLTVQAKTALGATGICQSPSAEVSGNTSPRPSTRICVGGRSPGFWKQPQKFPEWPQDAEPPTFNVPAGECLIGQSELTLDNIKTAGTLVEYVLPGASVPNGTGCWAVLAFPTSFGSDGQLMRHLIAAWLNAGAFGTDYPISRDTLRKMWEAVRDGGIYCPSGMSCDDKTGMDADEIKNYIEGMYDDPPLEKKVCTSSKTPISNGKKK